MDSHPNSFRERMTRWHISPWDHPLRTFLRARSVITILATGTLVVSTGAAATVIGIAEVQIASGRGGSVDLWGNNWFCGGLIVGLFGLVFLVLAIVSSASQVKARREFPDVLIEIVSQILRPGRELDSTKSIMDNFPDEVRPHHLFECGLRVTNRETNRYASLEFSFTIDTDEGRKGFRPPFAERTPWSIAPGMTDLRLINFVIANDDEKSAKAETGRIEVVDRNSSQQIDFPNAFRSTWRRS